MIKYTFPGVRGLQAENEYYTCMIPLGLLGKLFNSDNSEVPPEYRAQRKLNELRIPEIKDYILNNRKCYVFSALAASVDGNINFIPTNSENVGFLEIDMEATFLINDGQHRKAAILAAIEEDESLKDETIVVVLFKDKGLSRSQQMFTDLNKHAVVTSKSLNTLYESKEELALLTKYLVDNIRFFKRYTDKERDNLGKFSSNLFTLNNLYNANKNIFGNVSKYGKDDYDFAYNFWYSVVNNMREWIEVESGELSKKELRENYISTQGITLLALGKLGHYFYSGHIDEIEHLERLREIDWLRGNFKSWGNRAIKNSGKINRNEQGIFLTYIQIKRLIGVEITGEESLKEDLLGVKND